MSLSMYQASIPVFIRQLTNLTAVLDKAAADAEARKIEPEVFVNGRLAPDMFALARQVQIMADSAKGAGARLAGIEIPSYEDNEKTFADLKARIAKTIAFLKTLKPEQIDGSETRKIELKIRGNDITFDGQSF